MITLEVGKGYDNVGYLRVGEQVVGKGAGDPWGFIIIFILSVYVVCTFLYIYYISQQKENKTSSFKVTSFGHTARHEGS